MKYFILVIIILYSPFLLISQSNIDSCLEGVYKYEREIPREYIHLDSIPIWDTISEYRIFDSSSVLLHISINENIQESLIGQECYYISGESIYFYDYDQFQNICGDPSQNYYYNSYICLDDYVEFFKHNGFELFKRVEEVPLSLISSLYEESEATNKKYLEKYLNKNIKTPCEERITIFDSIDGVNKSYLIEGDLVEVLETQGEWSKIKYLRTDKEYWTYASCLK